MLEHEQVWGFFYFFFFKCSHKENMNMSVMFEAMAQGTFLDISTTKTRLNAVASEAFQGSVHTCVCGTH